ncbi:MAG TPA: signal peptidase II [Bacteroidota bacterium]|nr:signal peptidase II [Bacteroidota bacterium]
MRILYLSLFVVVTDQISKLMVKGVSIPFLKIDVQGLPLGSSRPILGDFLRLTYIENPGMAFGIDIGGKLFFSFFSIVASIGILIYLYKSRNENLPFRISLAMILGGAVGNLIDRVFYGVFYDEGALFHGKVVDFLDADFFNVNFFGYHMSRWPVFNVADAAVTCGVILMLFAHRKSMKEEALLGNAGTTAIVGAPEVMIRPDSTTTSTGSEPTQS